MSWNEILLSMSVGDRRYIETTPKDYPRIMRTSPKSRRPASLAGAVFTTSLFTAVGQTAGDVRYLVCIERES